MLPKGEQAYMACYNKERARHESLHPWNRPCNITMLSSKTHAVMKLHQLVENDRIPLAVCLSESLPPRMLPGTPVKPLVVSLPPGHLHLRPQTSTENPWSVGEVYWAVLELFHGCWLVHTMEYPLQDRVFGVRSNTRTNKWELPPHEDQKLAESSSDIQIQELKGLRN